MTYLKGIRAVLLRETAQRQSNEPFVIAVETLATRVATSKSALMAAMSLLSSVRLFDVEWDTVLTETGQEQDMFAIRALELPETLTEKAIESRLEFQSFAKAHTEIQAFRRWWMQAPLTVIESALAAALDTVASTALMELAAPLGR